jgi:hypothetical protein
MTIIGRRAARVWRPPQVAAASVLAGKRGTLLGWAKPSIDQLEEALRAGAEQRVDAATGIEFAVLNTRGPWNGLNRSPTSIAAAIRRGPSPLSPRSPPRLPSPLRPKRRLPRASRVISGETEAPFRASRIRIPQFASAGPAPPMLQTVVVGDGESATAGTIQLESLMASADERMQAIDLVFQLLGRP